MGSIEKGKVRKILIRSPNWLGDAVMATPALAAIRETFPGAHLTIMATPLAAQMLQAHPCADEVLVYDRKGIHQGVAGRVRMAQELRARSFDLAVLFPNSFDSALLPFMAHIPARMGTARDGRTFLLTHRYRPLERARHQVEDELARLAQFGIAGGTGRLLLCTTPAEDLATAELLASFGIKGDEFLLGVNPGATYGSAKRWYPERFAAAAGELAAQWGARVVITGSPAEAAMANAIAEALPGAVNLAGKTDVRGLLALIKRCNFFITNDSGPMHIAAAFDVPLVAVFGPTDHTATSPYARRTAIVRQEVPCAPCMLRECPTDHRCMTQVTARHVVQAAQQLVAEDPAILAGTRTVHTAAGAQLPPAPENHPSSSSVPRRSWRAMSSATLRRGSTHRNEPSTEVSVTKPFKIALAVVAAAFLATAVWATYTVFHLQGVWVYAENGVLEGAQASLLALCIFLFLAPIARQKERETLLLLFFSLLSYSFLVRELDVEQLDVPRIIQVLGSGVGRNVTLAAGFLALLGYALSRFSHYKKVALDFVRSQPGRLLMAGGLLLIFGGFFEKSHSIPHNALWEELLELCGYCTILLSSLTTNLCRCAAGKRRGEGVPT